jgi:hypothetical protein
MARSLMLHAAVVAVVVVMASGVSATWWEDLLPSFSKAPSCPHTDQMCIPTDNFGLSVVPGTVAALGDFNSDS